MNNNNIYVLSNSSEAIHFEEDIQVTRLGKLFNDKLTKLLRFEVVASNLMINRDWISIVIKERGKEGGSFGSVFDCIENNILCIQNAICQCIWNALCESLTEMCLQQLDLFVTPHNTITKKLHVTIYDFVKRSRVGFFMDNAVYLENELKSKYSDVTVSLRFKDDIQYYYLIFSTIEDLDKATQVYGIENMNNFIWNLCKKNDLYHVFNQPIPAPMVTTKQEILRNGKAMEIILNNPNFSGL